jgi:hypothetical protein
VEVEYSGLAAEIAGDLVGGGVDDGVKVHESGLRGSQLRFHILVSRPRARNLRSSQADFSFGSADVPANRL